MVPWNLFDVDNVRSPDSQADLRLPPAHCPLELVRINHHGNDLVFLRSVFFGASELSCSGATLPLQQEDNMFPMAAKDWQQQTLEPSAAAGRPHRWAA